MKYNISDSDLIALKTILREKDIPFFEDTQLQFFYDKNKGDINNTAFECLLIKAENNNLSMSGLSVADSSDYFRRIAAFYKPHNSRILKS